MKVEFSISAGLGIRDSEVIEYDDDITDEELSSEWNTWSMNYIEGGWVRLEDR